MANVAYDTSGVDVVPCTNPTTYSITIGNNPNRTLIVMTSYDSGNHAASAVTFNGVSMTLIDSAADNFGTHKLWGLLAPSTGTHDISISGLSSIGSAPIALWSLYNTDQTTLPLDVSVSSTANPVTTSITPSAAGGFVLGFLGSGAPKALATPTTHAATANGTASIAAADTGPTANTNAVSATSAANGGAVTLAVFAVSVIPSFVSFSVLDTVTTTQTALLQRAAAFTVLDTVTSTQTVSFIRAAVFSVIDTVTTSDFFSLVFKWVRQTRNTNNFTNQNRHTSTSWTDATKHTNTTSNATKHSTNWTDQPGHGGSWTNGTKH